MAVKRSTGLKNAMLGSGSLKDILDGGVIAIFNGPQPSSADDSENLYDPSSNPTGANKLLALISVSGQDYQFASGVNGLSFGTPEDGALPKASGTAWLGFGKDVCTESGLDATWFRFYAPGGNADDDIFAATNFGSDTGGIKKRFDGDCGSYGALRMSATKVFTDRSISIDAFTITLA